MNDLPKKLTPRIIVDPFIEMINEMRPEQLEGYGITLETLPRYTQAFANYFDYVFRPLPLQSRGTTRVQQLNIRNMLNSTF
jgi:hypothetical protein